MSLSTRRAPGIPSSVRPPRSASTTRGRERQDAYDVPGDNKYRTSSHTQAQRSRSVPRPSQDNPFRSRHTGDVPPMPSTPSRHSVQSSVSSTSSGSSALSAASTAPSSIWDYVGWKTNPTTSANEHEERIPSPEPVDSHTAQVDSGDTLWSRVAAVTGGLSINVGKAWEAKDDLPEPDTPPGRDSRVTVALKKHYIKQVSNPRQLPAWLFSDVERQVGRSYSRSESAPEKNQDEERRPSAPMPTRLRARHEDAYVQPQPQPVTGRDRMRTATYDEEYTGPTRAATRLRALRDAKRGPVDRGMSVPPAPAPVPEPEPEPVVAAPPRPRVGLPSRPGRARRD